MCKKLNLFSAEFAENGIYTVIRANSFEKAQSLLKQQTKSGKEVVEGLKSLEKMIGTTSSGDNSGEPQAIRVTLCKGKFCITVEFLKGIDIDIKIVIN